MDPSEIFTKFASRSLDIILTKYPTRTSLGIIVGAALYSLVQLFKPLIGESSFIDLVSVPFWGWLPIGLFITHIPTLNHSFKQKMVGDDPIDKVLELIKQGDFSEAERRRQYRTLITNVMQSIEFSKEKKIEIKKFESIINGQTDVSEEE